MIHKGQVIPVRNGLRSDPGLFHSRRHDAGRRKPLGSVLQFPIRERPALRAVLKRNNFVLDTEIDQSLGPDDRAGPPGAVDDHGGLCVGDQIIEPQRQFCIWTRNTTRYAEPMVFLWRASIQDNEIAALLLHAC